MDAGLMIWAGFLAVVMAVCTTAAARMPCQREREREDYTGLRMRDGWDADASMRDTFR